MLMSSNNLFDGRPPAKKLSDVQISEDVYKADFQIAERYTSFSSELIRLALLGIAGYGVLITQVILKCGKESNGSTIYPFDTSVMWISVVGVFFLGVALALALIHRFSSTTCLFDQILISRSLRRLENEHWSEVEKENEKTFLADRRNKQKKEALRYQGILRYGAISLFLGFILVVVSFMVILTGLIH